MDSPLPCQLMTDMKTPMSQSHNFLILSDYVHVQDDFSLSRAWMIIEAALVAIKMGMMTQMWYSMPQLNCGMSMLIHIRTCRQGKLPCGSMEYNDEKLWLDCPRVA